MTDGFMGPPWQMDWRVDALAGFEALPDHIREIVLVARGELVTAKDPYFRGIDADAGLPDGVQVIPARSTDPKGRHICLFDNSNGWLKYTFVRRTDGPQIVIEELFWQEADPVTGFPAEA
ncbi:hypothetical protein OG352_20100 [Streptomyces sp. NBC_01485]|uniref:hypothetical protein n=1 Tax=Streptomyces sp. NBC_01485 TaxID=2903884 RepID=UPI002E37EB45|nr:hypothetical protein [Streptomyces sp. NBC_01485]